MSNNSKRITLVLKSIYLLSLLLLITRCDSSKSSKTSNVTSNFTSIYTHVLSKNCVQCHEPQGSATINNSTQIDFSTQAVAYQTLTSLTSTGVSANLNSQCSGVPLVSMGHADQSYVLATLSATYFHADFYKSGCTPYSPSGHGATLSSTETQAIVEWIQNGAINN